jgi:signal transduction histidine kinase
MRLSRRGGPREAVDSINKGAFLSGEEDCVEYVEYPPEDHLSHAPNQKASLEDLLGSLGALAHKLAGGDSAAVLPQALREFLRLCHASRGLALSRPEGAAASRVAAMQDVSEDLAEAFAQEPRFWEMASGGVMFVSVAEQGRGAAGQLERQEVLIRRLAAAEVSWYAWLPLALSERAAAVLVVLGSGALPAAAERHSIHLAEALLADLAAGALERAHLRQLVASEEHARDEFIRLASHELKSPLTVIKGYAQLLLRQARRNDHGGSVDLNSLEAISQQVGRMSTLVGELLDFSRIERGVLEIAPAPIDVVALVRHVIEQRQRALPQMTFALIAREPELIALADRVRLEQVLGYLLDNAVKFGPEEGVVEITVQRALSSLLPQPLVLAHAEDAQAADQSSVALISVRDYGPGLPDEEHVKLFTAFYRGPEHSFQRQLAGLGLGLYLSRYLIDRQHGRLWAEFPLTMNETGGIFHLALPLAPAS